MIRAGLPSAGVPLLPTDQLDHLLPESQRRDQELPPAAPLGVAGQEIEQLAGVLAELGPGGEQAEVGVDPGGGRVVVAGGEVHVAADSLGLAADDQRRLAVGLEPDHPVDHVHAGLLQRAGPHDVVLLVEPGLELHQRGDLLAVLGRAFESPDDRASAAGAVERLLDRQHLGVLGGPLDEVHHRAERLEGMVDQDVLGADQVEHVGGGGKRRRHDRHQGLVLQIAEPLHPGERHEPGDVHRPGHPVHVAGLEIEGRNQHLDKALVRRLGDLQPHRVSPHPLAQVLLDGLEQVFRVVLIEGQVGVAGNPEDAYGPTRGTRRRVAPGWPR